MSDTIKQTLFGDISLEDIAANADFNEAGVRAVIIDPMLKELRFTPETIVRGKSLSHPVLKTGVRKRPVTLIPDYLLKVHESFAWVLDAKAPGVGVLDADAVEQVYSYAVHREIRSVYFALCNGVEFSLFRTSSPDAPVLYFRITEIDSYWDELYRLLSPESFQTGKTAVYEEPAASRPAELFDYLKRPLLGEIPVKKRAVKRHFGVHGYFTRQSWDIVSAYIKNFSQRGDLVLDPFGGSGVTAVEALMNNRKAVYVDLNPMAHFLVTALLAPVNLNTLSECYHKVRNEYINKEPKTTQAAAGILGEYAGPKNLPLPKGSDVETVAELFSPKQTAQLALLKGIIKKQKDKNIRNTLLLMFSGMVTKENLTYHTTKVQSGNNIAGGDASPFRYYRYRIAPVPRESDMLKYLDIRYQKVLAAKKEIEAQCLLNGKTVEAAVSDAQIIKGSATDLAMLPKESVDYIYTDPPYGKKIPYLDLSVMWNAWLDLDVSEKDYALEAIEGGEHGKTKDDYNKLIAKSIEEMYRVLKFDRWLSFVFAHKDPEFWHLIIGTCEKCGFEYAGAVPQKNGQTSFKKRQHPFTVLSGQLIINFKKVKNPRTVLKANLGMDISEMVIQTIEGIIARDNGAALEQINDELIIKGLELGFLDLLKKEYTDLTPLLLERFDYDQNNGKYTIKKDTRFHTQIDVRLRIRFYLTSFLRRMERENKTPTFNEIIFAILPLLKNGITPEHQTVQTVLEDIAERTGLDGWRLKPAERGLFD